MKRLASLLTLVLLVSCKDSRGPSEPAKAVVAQVVVTPNPSTVPVGETAQLQAEAQTSDGQAVVGRATTWSTTTSNFISVGSDGRVTGIAVGVATVSATVDGKTGSTTVTVTPAPVSAINVTLPNGTLEQGETVQATAVLFDKFGYPLTGRAVTWSTSNQAVAQVTPLGLVTAVSPGIVTITAQSEGKFGSVSIQVIVSVASVTIAPSAPRDVRIGQLVQLTGTPRDKNGNPVAQQLAWSTSNPAIATVSSTGLVTTLIAPLGGTVAITASAGGKSATVQLTTYGWEVEVFPSGVLRAYASLRAEDAQALVPTQTEWPTLPGLPLLAVACGDANIVLVQAFAPRLTTASGVVTYWFNNGPAQGAVWNESSSFSSLFHSGPQSATRAFITTLKLADTFTITFRQFGTNILYSPVFRIGGTSASGLAGVLPTVMAACPPTPGPILSTAEAAERATALAAAAAAVVESKLTARTK
jgi:uncharacterized protein YjdB